MIRYGDVKNFYKLFSLRNTSDYISNPERCVTGSAPTLCAMKRFYGEGPTRGWVEIQIITLSDLCGAAGKINNTQTAFCAEVILAQYGYLKVTDLLLYFSNLTAGKYGYFYGAIDPQRILAWINDYLHDRNIIYEQYESRLEAAQQARLEAEHKGKTVTYEEYQQMKAEGKI